MHSDRIALGRAACLVPALWATAAAAAASPEGAYDLHGAALTTGWETLAGPRGGFESAPSGVSGPRNATASLQGERPWERPGPARPPEDPWSQGGLAAPVSGFDVASAGAAQLRFAGTSLHGVDGLDPAQGRSDRQDAAPPLDPAGLPPTAGAEGLAKQLANPVASLISVPFQFNLDTGLGPKNTERLTVNIQPVVPFSISEDWNLITRTIVPVVYQGSLADGDDSDLGLGDTVQSFFFSPKEPVGGWILAAGPVALWPTGTDPQLRSEQLGLGPTALALRQDKGWTYGGLVNHIWSVTGSDDHPDVNATFLQPFLSYTWPTATTLTLNTETTYDWTGDQWTVPVNVILSQVVKFGDQPVQLFIGGRYYAETPVDGQEWGIRFGVTFLFPK